VSPAEAEAFARSSGAPETTERWGEGLASVLAVGDVVLLRGPLGSGKTCFVTGLARGLAVRGRVRSPSFGLIHEMHGRVLLVHVDLYRLDEREADRLGLEELRERGVLAVEWGERLPSPWHEDALTIEFVMLGASERELTARGRGPRGRVLLDGWRALGAPARRA
jgi:tRNA threonylcarbamoyladenosine biosynthesis protein TsaE